MAYRLLWHSAAARLHLIRSKRGQITILDPPTLEKLTNGTYGLAEAEYKRRIEARPN